jgi:SAM-dependent methyltransferase
MTDREQIEARVRELGAIQPWNHDHVLPHGISTRPGQQVSHGKNHVKLARLKPLFDIIGLNGKTVLDVGCNEGFFSLHMAKAGAHVLGIDVDDKRIEKARFVQTMIGSGYDERFELMDIYSDSFKALPRFDLCLCLGFIHRIPDPYRALGALADRSDMIIFEWKALKFGPHDEAFAYFSPKDISRTDFYGTEYWLLSYAAVERIMRRFGFHHFHRIDDPRQKRAVLVAGRNYHPLFDQSDVILHRGRIKSLLSHTKRFIHTIAGIIKGRVNA